MPSDRRVQLPISLFDIMQELGFDEAAVKRVILHTKAKVLQAVPSKVTAKRLTRHLPEYWDE
jgi:hypothetical protein